MKRNFYLLLMFIGVLLFVYDSRRPRDCPACPAAATTTDTPAEAPQPSAMFSAMFTDDSTRWSNYDPVRIYDPADLLGVGVSA